MPADLEDTLTKASQLLANYRGKISQRDRKVVYGLIGAAVFAFFLAIIIGMSLQDSERSPWFLPAFIIVFYLLSAYGVTLFFKYRSSYEYRMS